MHSSLSKAIAAIGDAEAARIGRVSERTAKAYRLGDRRPSPEVARRFVDADLTDWDGIYATDPQLRRGSQEHKRMDEDESTAGVGPNQTG